MSLLLALSSLLAACGGSAAPSAVPASSVAGPASAAAKPSAVASGSTVASAGASGLKRIRFGDISKSATSWPQYIATEKGFFAREGVQLETTYVGNVTTSAQAITGGSLDMANTNFEVAIRGIEGGAPFRIVGSGMLKYPYSVMSDPKVKTAADMNGKRAVMAIAKSSSDVFFRRWLKQNNVSENNVEIIYSGATPDRYAALKSGQVQAALLTQPFDFRAGDEGYYKLMDMGKFVGNDYAFLAIISPKQWIKDNPDAVRGFLKAYSDGIDFLYDPKNKEEAISILDKAISQDHSIDVKAYDYYVNDLQPYTRKMAVPASAMQGMLDTVVEEGDLKSPTPPASKYLDLGYLPQ
ncbi:MAG TPA: ABC transporter substrate-binding protein [Chloroflexota bacterium]|nr:ABC transporter substrate-binding protein [Chloroflexota bacterium]